MTDDVSPPGSLMEAAMAIHADNLHLLDRLASDDCNPGIELDCTLNGAQEHIFAFFEAVAAHSQGCVPWKSFTFMLDSTDALVRTLERRYGMASVHAVGLAFRASKMWWGTDAAIARLPRKVYLKHLFAAREAIFAALNTFNCELFARTATSSRTQRKTRPKKRLKGLKTPFMARQLAVYKAFLAANAYDGNERRLVSFATRCWLANKAKWDKARMAEGARKDYSCPKVLADAYRKQIILV